MFTRGEFTGRRAFWGTQTLNGLAEVVEEATKETRQEQVEK